jgi:hypothetical protein
MEKHAVVTDTGFSFDKDTYMYGNELGDYDVELFNTKYTTSEIEVKGRLTEAEFNSIKTCFANSPNVKRKYRRMLVVNKEHPAGWGGEQMQ